MTRTVQIGLAAILAVILALLAYSRIGERGAPYVVEEQATSPTAETGSGGEATTEAVQTREESPVASGANRPTSGASRERQRSSSAKEVQSAGGYAPDADSPSFETAGPPVFYMDQADDAHGQNAPPNAALSQKEFDILRVDWGPVAYVNEESPGGYSTSMTIAGSARDWDDNAMYVSWARFGRDCRLYHFLIPRTTAYANAFCDSYSGHPWGFVGRVEGGPVTSTPTQSGGTLLSATFDNRAIPVQLETARTLYRLSAYTCTGRIDEPLNICDGDLDWANSWLSYQI
ncbi:MAG: hypothetical protein KY429_09845 [Actinobacteria bacterium]|nr:hypothetical protein [Actinomycetota bacterium]